MAWVQIAVMVGLALISAGISYYQSKKAEKDLEKNLPEFNDGSVPRVTESDPIPVIFGTPVLNAPNVVWWKNQGVRVWREDFRFNRVRTHMVLCQGPVESVRIFVDGLPMRDAANTEEFDLTGGVYDFSGVVASEGDPENGKPFLIGYNAFMPGLPSQVAPAEMISGMDMGALPGFRGVFSMYALIGFTANTMKPFSYWVRRVGIRSNGEPQWQPTLADIGVYDMNPAHIIRELYTDKQWGLGRPEADIDETSFVAAATQLKAEGFGLSITWAQPGRYSVIIEEVCRHISAACYEEPSTGKLVLKLIRDDFDVNTIPVLGPSVVRGNPVVTRPQPFELVNSVELEYYDRFANRDRTVVARDTASEQLRGTISDQVSYPFIQQSNVANRAVTQELLQRSAPLANIRLTVSPSVGKDLRAGDVVIVEYPSKGIERVVLRITDQVDPSIHDEDAGVIIEGVEDVFAFEAGMSSIPPDIDLGEPVVPSAPKQEALELPLWMAYQYNLESVSFATIDALLDQPKSLVSLAASTADSANVDWQLETESSVMPRRVADARLDFSPNVSLEISSVDVDHPDGAINYTGGEITFTLTGEGVEEPLAGEWLLIYLPDVADSYGAFPQIAAIEVTSWVGGIGNLYIGLFDTTTPVIFPQKPSGVVLGYVDWSESPTIRRIYGVDRHAYPQGEVVDLKAFTRTLTKLLPESEALTSQVTTTRRMQRPYAPGNISTAGVNDGADGYVRCDYSQRFRGGPQRLQTDAAHQVESGWNLNVEVYETVAPYTSFTYLGDAVIQSQQEARWSNAKEIIARGSEELAPALLFVLHLDAPEESLYSNTHLYIRS